ncbi:MAG: FHA domain-containing protein [Chromatiales bacterium]|nr:FHA domain-containing protein [Gammaproteobacteria bacterium]MBW6476182.1 FHA domain-containing protein [Chromatiales bacterium]
MSKLTLTFKGKVLKAYQVTAGEMLIGSDSGCQIHIDTLALSPKHASIMTANHISTLQDLGGEGGTFLNGKAITETQTLKHDDEIRLGKHSLTYTADLADLAAQEGGLSEPEPEPVQISAKSLQKHAWMQILNGANVGKTISLNRTLTNLGKPGVQLAVIARRGEGYYLSHLEGERSPSVDGVAIGDQSYPLQDGNIIQIGNVKMQFTLA